jgi:hypothetical protein
MNKFNTKVDAREMRLKLATLDVGSWGCKILCDNGFPKSIYNNLLLCSFTVICKTNATARDL